MSVEQRIQYASEEPKTRSGRVRLLDHFQRTYLKNLLKSKQSSILKRLAEEFAEDFLTKNLMDFHRIQQL